MEVFGLCSTMIRAGEAIPRERDDDARDRDPVDLETPSYRSSTCLADSNVSSSANVIVSTPFAVPHPVR
jgi:hypothetical protein